jgi:hypothetical protein
MKAASKGIAEKQWVLEASRRRNEVRSGKMRPIPAAEVYRRIERLLEKRRTLKTSNNQRRISSTEILDVRRSMFSVRRFPR